MNLARWQVLTKDKGWLRLFLGTNRGKDTNRAATITRRTDSRQVWRKPPLLPWAEDFIFAGGSALLLLLANIFPQFWYFSFFALTPFLYRIVKAAPVDSLRLGFLFGLPFFGVWLIDSLFASPLLWILKLLSGTVLFALFGWAIGKARQRFGFDPSLVALLWVGLQMGLIKLGLVGGFLGETGFTHPFLHGLIGLFGFLAASAIIVLLNALLVLAITKTLEVIRPRRNPDAKSEKIWNFNFTRNFFTEKLYLVPEGRAPPCSPSYFAS
jgi:apolipoprotein N-acyltransferase